MSDDLIINNDSFHFWFNGCKFVNLDLIRRKKMIRELEKDAADLRLIELYYDCIRYFDNKKILKEQIQNALNKRTVASQSLDDLE